MKRVSQPWPGLAVAMLLATGCDDLFNLERVSFTYEDAAPDAPVAPNDIVQIAAGGRTSCARTGGGDVYCWGTSLTTLAMADSSRPRMVVSNARDVGVGDGGVCVTFTDRTAKCWGDNTQGELGVGMTGNVASPMSVLNEDGQPADDILSIAVGNSLTCAIRTTGRVTCAGAAGLLGNGTTTANNRHGSAVSMIGTALMVAIGDRHACAIRAGGEVYCWGDNNRSQLGVEGSADGTEPLPIPAIDAARVITSGDEFSCAIRQANDALFCWGANDNYQTGDGTQTDHAVPALVAGQPGNGAQATAAGAVSGYLLTHDGTVSAWGLNQFGQLGLGTTDTETVATMLPLTNVAEISSGTGLHACARTHDGRVYCWGSNNSGQVGDGTKTDALSPVEVGGLP